MYNLDENLVYIEDIYVVPEKRKEGYAKKYADIISEKAKKMGLTTMLGSVAPQAVNADISIKILQAYGMRVYNSTNNLIYFIKEL